MKVFAILLLFVFSEAFGSKIEPQVISSLESTGSANIFVSFEIGPSDALKFLSTQDFGSRAEKVNKVKSFLQEKTDVTQVKVLAYLKKDSRQAFRSFWISNQIYIENASSALVNVLANFPEVSAITEETVVTMETTASIKSSPSVASNDDLTWGLIKIGVPDVWNMVGGNRGEGIVVGGIDSGVLGTHEALRDNFIGEYGWFDPAKGTDHPVDYDGHGTHTMGTIAGSHGIGVAPGAKWMACKACENDMCSMSRLIACGEFMLCPTLTDGSNSDCTKAPRVVCNSWGGSGNSQAYNSVIDAWLAAGIVPLFASGNQNPNKPRCGGVNSPADHPLVIAVGNTDANDGLYGGSEQGPAISGIIKPDVSAPGTKVYSAYVPSDNSYYETTGTSMACPHVTGVVALLLSNNPTLTVDQIREYLISSVEQDGLTKPGLNCGGVNENSFPNNAFGHGRVSAVNSFTRLLQHQARNDLSTA